MTASLDTIILFTKDLSLLKHFYNQQLNLAITEEIPEQWVVFGAGNCCIALHKIPEEYIPENIDNSGNNVKLVFSIDSDINLLRNQLLLKQINISEIKTWDNYPYWLCEGKDPEGNTFQLQQKKNNSV